MTLGALVLAAVVGSGAGSAATAAGGAQLGSIRGTVEVRLALAAPRARPSVRELGSPDTRGRPNRAQSIVYLETAPTGAFEAVSRRPTVMDQEMETFEPYALPIRMGTTVSFPNSDPVFHNVFSFSKPKRFDLGRYPRGETKTVRFDEPGIVRVFCEIHSHMSAFILVFSHPYYASTDDDGRFRLDGVPPGTYDVVVWTDGEVRETRSVTLGPGASVTADFVVE